MNVPVPVFVMLNWPPPVLVIDPVKVLLTLFPPTVSVDCAAEESSTVPLPSRPLTVGLNPFRSSVPVKLPVFVIVRLPLPEPLGMPPLPPNCKMPFVMVVVASVTISATGANAQTCLLKSGGTADNAGNGR